MTLPSSNGHIEEQKRVTINQAKKKAAYAAVEEFVTSPNMIVGIGSGSTVVFAVQAIVDKAHRLGWANVACVPTSFQAEQLISQNMPILQMKDLSTCPCIDVTIDGADEVDSALNLIKGGGGCQLREKIVAYNSKKMVVIADYTKDSLIFGQNWKQGLPLEVIPFALTPVCTSVERVFAEFNVATKCVLRMATNKAGPVVSDNGNFIVDCQFDGVASENVAPLDAQLHMIPGVVETGFFPKMACKAFFGQADGSVLSRL